MKKRMTKTILTLSVLLLACVSFGQVTALPDAPMRQPEPATTCGSFHWACWTGPNVSTRDVFKSKSYYAFVLADFALSTADAKLSEDAIDRGCVEGGPGFPLRPTLGAYMRANIPETAAVAGVGFLWLKLKGPKWVLPLLLTAPAIIHGRDIASGVTCGR